MKIRRSSTALWTLIVMFLLFVAAKAIIRTAAPGIVSALHVLFLLAITIIHALVRYRKKELLVFFVITFAISNLFENLSILSGFPFGHYHYSDNLGPKLFQVPLLIAPAYFGAGYLAWTLAHVLLGIFGNRLQGRDIVLVPLLAAIIMVMWDMALDPIAATVQHSWIWHDGGSYFGVPFSNYMGWLLCVYTIFQLFALYLSFQQRTSGQLNSTDRTYWYQAAVTFAILGLSLAINSLTGYDSVVFDQAGQQWHAIQIYNSVTLVTIFTIWFVALLSSLLIAKAPISIT
jgi:putative membrane protein